eukprot:TRINITY_DN49166_c0_g1_i2.p2 TRINITY_DN49166_c0_g1~~TRINITY_DN49166_c0_g1_i2.p2  ORF type:complete len:116 (+),score=15.39 TRINITY_DN49166_c0_g1_i2:320-667(+)
MIHAPWKAEQHAEFGQQLAIFSNARAIIGAHGAGLANQIWMPKGGVVIEFSQRHDTYHYESAYQPLAAMLGHKHWIIDDLPKWAVKADLDWYDAESKEAQKKIVGTVLAAVCHCT